MEWLRDANAAKDDPERPFNNLLRRLSAGDFALDRATSCAEEAKANDLLYNPGDDVEIVHFPVRAESGVLSWSPTRTAATSKPFWSAAKARSAASSARDICRPIPASCVKFGGPFVRLRVGKLDAAKAKSATLRNVFARYADCMLAQMFQSTACNAIHSIEQRTAKWIISAMERTDGDCRAADA